MKTAEEILKEAIGEIRYNLNGSVANSQLEYAINEARIEAIKECAEKARCKPMVITDDFEMSTNTYYGDVDKQSILNLITSVK